VLSAPVSAVAGEAPGGCVRPVRTKSLGRMSSKAHTAPAGELAALPGVSSVQTAPIIATFKRTGSVH
jgi:hypothetical protein